MNDVPKEPPAPADAAGAFDAAMWRKMLLALNPWAHGLAINERDEAFAAARQVATLERHAQGKEAWNSWANSMLALRAELETAKLWDPEGEEARHWRALATAIFSEDSRKHVFEGETQFAGLVFPFTASFTGATFRDIAWFNGATFGTAWFDGAIFSGTAWFVGATFTGTVSFDGAIFSGTARFDGATLSGTTWFAGATFTGSASFARATLSGGASFAGATFSDNARFTGATFSGIAWFAGATFSGTAWFDGATFESHTYVNDVRFDGPVDLAQATFKGAVTLDRSVFQKSASFEAIDSEAAFSLADATFRQVPSFIGATFKGALRLDDVTTPRYRWSFGWTPDKNASAHFRELKRRAVEAHDSDRELEFFSQEIRTARFHASFPTWKAVEAPAARKRRLAWGPLPSWVPRFWSWRFWFGLAYGTFSNFGRSLWRPFLFWLALVAGFAVFYLGQHEAQRTARKALAPQAALSRIAAYAATARTAWSKPPACMAEDSKAPTDPVSEALYLSLKNGLVFDAGRGDAARRTYGCLYGFEQANKNGPPVVPYRVAVASNVQTLASAVVIFLFLLAVRNLLRLK